MTAVERLAQIEARAASATEGPWEAAGDNDDYVGLYGPGSEPIFAPGEDEGLALRVDAEFIAAARVDVPWLVEQVRIRDGVIEAGLAVHAEHVAPLIRIERTGQCLCVACNMARAITAALDVTP